MLYGPQGQTRRESSVFPVGGTTIPSGSTYYWAEALEQGKDLVQLGPDLPGAHVGWRWGVGIERGIDRRTSLGLSAQSLMLAGGRHSYLEARLQRAFGPLLVELSGAQQYARGSLRGRAARAIALGEVAGVSFEAESVWAFGGFTSELVDGSSAREHRLRLDKSFDLGKVSVPLQLGARQSVSRSGQKVTELLTRLGLHARRFAATAELSRLTTSRQVGAPDAPSESRLSLLVNASLSKVRLRGEARFRVGGGASGTSRRSGGRNSGFESARLIGEMPLGERSDLRLGGEYDRASGRKALTAGYVRQFRAFALRADGDIASDGSIGAGLQIAFSLGSDPLGGGLHLSNEKLALNGEAAVSVWRDEDANGRRDPGEEAIEGVEIGASLAKSAPTDSAGHALVTGLRPYQAVALAIDTSSLEDPFLVPASQGVVVTPRPGIAARVEIPLVPTGEVEAALLDGNGDPLAGVLLELVDTRGAAMAQARSEFDGFVLFEKVPYGVYRVAVAAESAPALSGVPAVIASARVDRAQAVARLGRIVLHRAARLAAAP